jgi:hypothetical protein
MLNQCLAGAQRIRVELADVQRKIVTKLCQRIAATPLAAQHGRILLRAWCTDLRHQVSRTASSSAAADKLSSIATSTRSWNLRTCASAVAGGQCGARLLRECADVGGQQIAPDPVPKHLDRGARDRTRICLITRRAVRSGAVDAGSVRRRFRCRPRATARELVGQHCPCRRREPAQDLLQMFDLFGARHRRPDFADKAAPRLSVTAVKTSLRKSRSSNATEPPPKQSGTARIPACGAGGRLQLIGVQVPSVLRQAVPRAVCGLPSM